MAPTTLVLSLDLKVTSKPLAVVASRLTGSFGDGAGFADIDELIFALDKQGAPQEYAMYVDTATSLNIDDMLAAGIATQTTAGLPGQFGAFQNSADMAVSWASRASPEVATPSTSTVGNS